MMSILWQSNSMNFNAKSPRYQCSSHFQIDNRKFIYCIMLFNLCFEKRIWTFIWFPSKKKQNQTHKRKIDYLFRMEQRICQLMPILKLIVGMKTRRKPYFYMNYVNCKLFVEFRDGPFSSCSWFAKQIT